MGDHNLFPLKVRFEDEKKGKRLYWNQLETYKKKKGTCVLVREI